MTYCKIDTNLDCSVIIAEMYCIEKKILDGKNILCKKDTRTSIKSLNVFSLSQRVLCSHSETQNVPMKNRPISRCTKTTRCKVRSLSISGDGHWRIQKGRVKSVFDFIVVFPIPCENDSWFQSKFHTWFYNFGHSTEKLDWKSYNVK
jgi:hypothetical protein